MSGWFCLSAGKSQGKAYQYRYSPAQNRLSVLPQVALQAHHDNLSFPENCVLCRYAPKEKESWQDRTPYMQDERLLLNPCRQRREWQGAQTVLLPHEEHIYSLILILLSVMLLMSK